MTIEDIEIHANQNVVGKVKTEKENVFCSIEYTLSQQVQDVKNSGFWYNIQGINPDWEKILDGVERQFELV